MSRLASDRVRRSVARLTVTQILVWADAHRRLHGSWPTHKSGRIPGTETETWQRIDGALRNGNRGLPRGLSVARLLAKHRGHRNIRALPRLRLQIILHWADLHKKWTGEWPKATSGRVRGGPNERWSCIQQALRVGGRGLPGGSSLTQLLEEARGLRNVNHPPRLTHRQILAWADAHHRRTGAFPRRSDGAIADAPGESWHAIDGALYEGLRGLPGGSSLNSFLSSRGRHVVRRRRSDARPLLTESTILTWADKHFRRTGQWPTQSAGSVVDGAPDSWANIHNALVHGHRGLPGGDSLFALLVRTGRREPSPRDTVPRRRRN